MLTRRGLLRLLGASGGAVITGSELLAQRVAQATPAIRPGG